MERNVSIINYGIGNILSIQRALEEVGAGVKIVSTPEEVINSDRLILPGVGAFRKGMDELKCYGLIESILDFCKENRPFLGICLGMQMMLDESEEFGKTSGLGIIHGRVIRIDNTTVQGEYQKVPHVGWNEIHYVNNQEHTIMREIPENSTVYFTHSYTAFPEDERNRLADSFYGGRRLAAIIRKGNLYGTQFHPEKSGINGLKIVKAFVELT